MGKRIFVDEIDIHSMSITELQDALAEVESMKAKMAQELQERQAAQKYNIDRMGDSEFFNVVKNGVALGYARVISMREDGKADIEFSGPVDNLPADDKTYILNQVSALVKGK